MNIYAISQSKVDGYDTYSDAVVCAENEDEAKIIHPNEDLYIYNKETKVWSFLYADGRKTDEGRETGVWCHPDDVFVELLGEANENIKKGMICTSFHAG